MKQYFMLAIGAIVVAAVCGYLLWLLLKAIWTVFSDMRLHRELDVLEAESRSRKQAKLDENARRLDNGCEHAFDDPLGVLPPGVCRKCGLEREKPSGTCDHIWRRGEGAAPFSYCEKCGKKHGRSAASFKS